MDYRSPCSGRALRRRGGGSDDAESAAFYTLAQMSALPLAGSVLAIARALLVPGPEEA